jgi:hypothetical protein
MRPRPAPTGASPSAAVYLFGTALPRAMFRTKCAELQGQAKDAETASGPCGGIALMVFD